MAYNNQHPYAAGQPQARFHQHYYEQSYGQSDATLAYYGNQSRVALEDAERGMSEADIAQESFHQIPSPLTRAPTSSSMNSNESTATLVSAERIQEKVAAKESAIVEKEKEKEKPAKAGAVGMQRVEDRPPAPLPTYKVTRWTLWQLWFNTYKKFFVAAVLLNLIFIVRTAKGQFPYADNHAGSLVLGNLLAAIVVRNEIFGRALYLIAQIFSKWSPLFVRLGISSALQHVGGIHTGCSISAFAWLIYKLGDLIASHGMSHPAVIATGVITALTMTVSMLIALPWIRNNHHNTFELYHRFFGWIGLLSTWIFTLLGNAYQPLTKTWDASAGHMFSSAELWFTIAITVFVLLPWVCVAEVAVEVEIPSPKVAILKFQGGMQQGVLARISRTAWKEYHAFGIISEGLFADHHYLICGVQGDFTRGLVENIPKTIWTRRVKFAAVGNTSALYRRGIRVCTGTGIGAGLSTCMQDDGWFLIWCGSDLEKTFGKTLCDMMYRNIPPERRILWDSKKEGKRPDLLKLTSDLFYEWRAEVVMITSNGKGNDELMRGLKAQGIPAFGTLFDF